VLALGSATVMLRPTSFAVPEARVLILAATAVATLFGGLRSGAVAAAIGAGFVVSGELGRTAPGMMTLHVLAILLCPPIVSAFVALLGRANEERAHSLATTHVVEYYRRLLEELGAVVWVLDLEARRVTFVSPSATGMLGVTPEALKESERLWIDIQHPDDVPRTMAALERVRHGGGDEVTEHRTVRPDGSVVWLQTAIRGGVGALGHRVARGIALDITAHKQAQSRLQETLSLLGATLESTADGILVVDASGHVTHYNRRFAEIWGLADDVLRAGDQVLDHVAGQVMPRDEFLVELRTRDVDRDPTPVEVLELRDGRMLERSSQPERIDGLVVGRVWSSRDITERTL